MPMNDTLQMISLVALSIAFIPVVIALAFLYLWSLNVKQASYALSRMLVQLLFIGYALSYIFYSDNVWLITAILFTMVSISCWIALRTLPAYRLVLFKQGFIAILCGGFTLLVISQGALSLSPCIKHKLLFHWQV
jgi:putative ABC transport system permease protein